MVLLASADICAHSDKFLILPPHRDLVVPYNILESNSKFYLKRNFFYKASIVWFRSLKVCLYSNSSKEKDVSSALIPWSSSLRHLNEFMQSDLLYIILYRK